MTTAASHQGTLPAILHFHAEKQPAAEFLQFGDADAVITHPCC